MILPLVLRIQIVVLIFTITSWWGSSDRGQVPIGWTITPALSELAPLLLDYFYNTATAEDEFVGAASGFIKLLFIGLTTLELDTCIPIYGQRLIYLDIHL